MGEMIGFAVVGIIIAGLTYALIKQVIETKRSGSNVAGPLFRKQMAGKNKVMTIALLGILVFYTLNILSVISSSIPVSNSLTVQGTWLSFLVYFVAKFAMKPQLADQRKLNV
ncbi:4-aminobutyrate aminotransferase [Solibacillus sp. FSL W7-1464]|uniref:4-aminobutyrate aminotransferase n=1 Tax=Solibacillus sp. FSL W7-1464 TaxID=2921706 RepID=UPI0030F7C9B7